MLWAPVRSVVVMSLRVSVERLGMQLPHAGHLNCPISLVLQACAEHRRIRTSKDYRKTDASPCCLQVISTVRSLLYFGLVRTIDVIVPSNVYVPTSRIRDLIKSPSVSQQCVAYCKPEGGGGMPSVRQVLDFLLSMQPGKNLAQICCEQGK